MGHRRRRSGKDRAGCGQLHPCCRRDKPAGPVRGYLVDWRLECVLSFSSRDSEKLTRCCAAWVSSGNADAFKTITVSNDVRMLRLPFD
jgi:hypothetical protein